MALTPCPPPGLLLLSAPQASAELPADGSSGKAPQQAAVEGGTALPQREGGSKGRGETGGRGGEEGRRRSAEKWQGEAEG